MYISDFSRSVGAGRATTRNTLGLTLSVIRLMVPPLPAVSRPSKTMQTLAPVAFTHSCMATSSPCRTRISFEFLHDVRVAVRRTRSLLKLGRPALPGHLQEVWEPQFKGLRAVTRPAHP